jgi:hypothetical protein
MPRKPGMETTHVEANRYVRREQLLQSVLLAQKRLVKINSSPQIGEAVTDTTTEADLSPNGNRCTTRKGNNYLARGI